MSIPKEILAVERPSSTRVKKSGDRYLVIKRTSKRVGDRTVPVELGTIGEIVNGQYISIRDTPRRKRNQVDIKDYGEIALCMKAAENLFSELTAVFDTPTAKKLFAISMLRVADPDVKDRDLQFAYDTSYLSELYPGISLSENTVSNFLLKTGMAYNTIREFMKRRVENYSGGKFVIDGTLKNCNGHENTMAEYSRKGATKGSEDMNLIYAYDLESREPVAVKPYPGNMLDLTAVPNFIEEFNIKNAFLVMDKGFYSKESIKSIRSNPNILYIIPLKSSAKQIEENGMNTDIVSPLVNWQDGTVFYKKAKIAEGIYLYAFRNPKIAGEQEIGYYQNAKKKGSFSEEKLREKQKEFGVIVFESNADIDPHEVYEAYARRWEIEAMFSLYKGIIDLGTVNVQTDYRIITSEFINYLSVTIGLRIRHIFKSTVLNPGKGKGTKQTKAKTIAETYSYKQIMHYLSKYKMVRVGDSDKWVPCQTVKYISLLVSALGV